MITFVIGGVAFAAIAWLLWIAGIVALVDWVLTSSFQSISQMNIAFWILTVIYVVTVSALAMLIVVIIMRRIGFKVSRPSAQKMMLIAGLLYLAITVLQMKMATTPQLTYPSVARQVWGAYLIVLEFGLPFTVAWFWVTRGASLDRSRRKA